VPAKAALPTRLELPDYLPARMLNEFVYCPRLFFYEWVEGVFRHSSDTIEGSLASRTSVWTRARTRCQAAVTPEMDASTLARSPLRATPSG
jgi:CRISPR-associated protein Cas1